MPRCLELTSLEDRFVPAFMLPTSFAVGEDTASKAEWIGYDPTSIRHRTGDPTLASPFAYGIDAQGKTSFSLGMGSEFTGGARVARADVTGDAVDDLIVASGPGTPSRVRVYQDGNFTPVFTFSPFEAGFLGGVNVSAGDVTGDGVADLMISPDEGGGPRVIIIRGGDWQPLASFFAIDDANFRGGVRTAVADFDNDGIGDLAAAAGFGGGPRVAVFDGTTLAATPTRLFADRMVFEEMLRNGSFVGAGDLDGDGHADLFTAAGPGGAPRLQVLSGESLLAGGNDVLANHYLGNTDLRSGLRIAVKDLDGDTLADLVIGNGPGSEENVRLFSGSELLALPGPGTSVNPFFSSNFADGVWVG
jgi:hypothetical protein